MARLYSRDGDPIEPADVLDGPELAAYRRLHPRAPMHQLRLFPGRGTEAQCDRCEEFYAEGGCTHGRVLCATCAPTGCQECEAELADEVARIQQREDEHNSDPWWGGAA